jgi:hypothetical protein
LQLAADWQFDCDARFSQALIALLAQTSKNSLIARSGSGSVNIGA